jgi:RHS repeat-associated protein
LSIGLVTGKVTSIKALLRQDSGGQVSNKVAANDDRRKIQLPRNKHKTNFKTLNIKYLPFGVCRNSPDLPTDKLFTGQRLDGTGLYYYNARYYDPTIGRFISPDTVIADIYNPQCLNAYSYCLNNPLKYTDPTGNVNVDSDDDGEPYDPYKQALIEQIARILGENANSASNSDAEPALPLATNNHDSIFPDWFVDFATPIGKWVDEHEEGLTYTFDAMALGGDVISLASESALFLNPVVAGIGYLGGYFVSSIGSFGGLALTAYKMSQGEADKGDLAVSFGTWVVGYVPGPVGIGAAMFQLGWDIFR